MLREVPMRMFSSLKERINVVREPKYKLLMFPLVSAGCHVGVPQTGSKMASPY